MRVKRVLLLLALVLIVAVTLPTVGFQGFIEDNPEPCLGGNDPFCPPGNGNGGGGGGTHCYACSVDCEGAVCTISCAAGSLGNTCTVTFQPNGNISCQVSGSC